MVARNFRRQSEALAWPLRPSEPGRRVRTCTGIWPRAGSRTSGPRSGTSAPSHPGRACAPGWRTPIPRTPRASEQLHRPAVGLPRRHIHPGDLAVFPLKTARGSIRYGRVTGCNYFDAAARLEALATIGRGPGLGEASAQGSGAVVVKEDVSADVTDPDPVPTVETIRDRIRAHVAEHFREHELTHLVAEILTVLAFHCEVSPPGPTGEWTSSPARGRSAWTRPRWSWR